MWLADNWEGVMSILNAIGLVLVNKRAKRRGSLK